MTVQNTTIVAGPYSGNDVADTFNYTWRIEDKSEITVIQTDDTGVETILVVDTDYTVAGISDDGGGSITLIAGALVSGYTLYMRSAFTSTQLTAFSSQGSFLPENHEAAFDKATRLIQQLEDYADRGIRIPLNEDIGTFDPELASADIRANQAIVFDDNGDLDYALITSVQTVGIRKGYAIATASQVAFTTAPYVLGSHNLNVFINGVRQASNAYIETNTTTFTLVAGVDEGDLVEYNINVYPELAGTQDASAITFTQAGTGAIARTASDKFEEFVSVKDFGATGDGVTDDTAAIQAAYDSLTKSGTLFFPQGTYLYSSLSFDLIGVKLVGVGQTPIANINTQTYFGTTLVCTSTTGNSITFNHASFEINFTGISNMSIISNTTGNVVYFNDAPKSILEQCIIVNEGTGDGVEYLDGWIASIYGTEIHKGTRLGNIRTGTGLKITNSGAGGLYNLFQADLFEWDNGGIVGEQSATPTGTVQNFNFIGSQCKSNNNGLTLAGGVESASLQGSYFEGNVNRSIYVQYGALSVGIRDNFFNDPGVGVLGCIQVGEGGGVDALKQFGKVVIDNNQFSSSNAAAILIDVVASTIVEPAGVTIRDNDFRGSGTAINLSGAFIADAYDNEYASTLAANYNDITRFRTYRDKTRILGPTKNQAGGLEVLTLTATTDMTVDSPNMQSLDPTTATRIRRVPDAADSEGVKFIYINRSTTYNVDIKTSIGDGNTLIKAAAPLTTYMLYCDGISWHIHDMTIAKATSGITAFATGGQGSAVVLTNSINEISVCATIGDSVKLLPAISGTRQSIINNGAAACNVFPDSGDDIGAGTDTAISLAAGAGVTYACFSSTQWGQV